MREKLIRKAMIKLSSKFKVGDIVVGIGRYDFIKEVQVTSVSDDGEYIGFPNDYHDLKEICEGTQPNFPASYFKKVYKH